MELKKLKDTQREALEIFRSSRDHSGDSPDRFSALFRDKNRSTADHSYSRSMFGPSPAMTPNLKGAMGIRIAVNNSIDKGHHSRISTNSMDFNSPSIKSAFRSSPMVRILASLNTDQDEPGLEGLSSNRGVRDSPFKKKAVQKIQEEVLEEGESVVSNMMNGTNNNIFQGRISTRHISRLTENEEVYIKTKDFVRNLMKREDSSATNDKSAGFQNASNLIRANDRGFQLDSPELQYKTSRGLHLKQHSEGLTVSTSYNKKEVMARVHTIDAEIKGRHEQLKEEAEIEATRIITQFDNLPTYKKIRLDIYLASLLGHYEAMRQINRLKNRM